MPWINLDNIDINQFLRGDYIPPNYHAPISRVDLRYLFPHREYEISIDVMDNERVKNYFKEHNSQFLISHEEEIDNWVIEKAAYMPGPGNRRPTNSILRYLRKDAPFFAYVAKVGYYSAGVKEFEKQKDLYEIGFPTPKPFFWDNGALLKFIDGLISFLNFKLKNNSISLEDYKETMRIINYILNNKEELIYLKSHLKRDVFTDSAADNEAVELLNDYLKGRNLQFASILWMEFKFSTSFEELLYNILGGRQLDEETGTIELYNEERVLPWEDLTKKIPELLNKLWSLTTHNDLKGEHIRWDETNNANRFIMIDWGTSGGGTIEYIPRDLGILLYDVTMFIVERSLFSRKFKQKIHDSESIKLEKEILSKLEDFWYEFLLNIDSNSLNSEVVDDTLKFLEPKKIEYIKDASNALRRLKR